MVTSSSSSIHDEFQGTKKEGSVTLGYLMLTKTNYSVWAIKTRVNLQAQGVWDATQREGVEDRQDRMALAAIYQAIPEDVLLMLADKDTAKEACETIRTMHMGADRVKEAKVQTLRSDFEVIRMKGSESMDEFAMRLNTIVTGIRSLVDTIEEITVSEGVAETQIVTRCGGDEDGVEMVTVVEIAAAVAGVGRSDGKHVHKDKSKIKCFACEEFGNYASECPKRLAEEANLTESVDEEPTLMMANSQENAYSKWSWVYTLTGKFKAFEAFKRYKKMVEERSGYKVKTLRTDRGGEFTSKYFAKFCEENETPQNNPQTTHNQPENPEFETEFSRQLYPEDVQADLDPNIAVLDPFSSPSSQYTNSPNAPGPRGFRSLNDIYASTHEVTLESEELMMAKTDQPSTFEEAMAHKAWQEAMQAELDAIEKNKTWQLTSLPPGHKAIDLKWVYKVKKDNMGNVVKYKARLVAKGYVKKQGVDYDEVFTPVARLDTIRVIFSLIAQHGWSVHHLDVKSAFLNGDLEKEVYVTQPEGYVKKGHSDKVLKLFKALYGLKQAPRAWNDIIEFKEPIKNEFEMSDMGLLACYLGIEVSQKKDNKPFYGKTDNFALQVVKRILRYIRGTFDYGINYEKGSEFKDLVRFTDSDHGGDPIGGKSTGSMIFYLGRNAITWQSHKQKTVALSFCEAEFMVATLAACQAIWLVNLVKELTGQYVEPITLFVDNKPAIALMKNLVFMEEVSTLTYVFTSLGSALNKARS
uniref:Ribonuclease H-like domain, reverse transcriptase, RNA-dependent DNA polymerase n=1 Tax=Tanacetum cinerariifolium TaxID=118510 RepID=A0A6L2LMZ2_TANCI|nr:ribonuclease H-like domain, reverse transcriptase, RNA-dependent DNA polymerase [Tanacetum cinerariifolium]